LLKIPDQTSKTSTQPIINEEWIKVVNQAKKRSISSIFLKRNYSIYKCAVGSEKMNYILIKFYNTIIKKVYYPKQMA